MVGYSKDFGYLLQENNVIGGVANGVDQIYGVMIMSDNLNTMMVLPRKIRDKVGTTLYKIHVQVSMKKNITLNEKFPFKTVITLDGMKTHSLDMKERGLNMINGIDGVREK